MEASDNLLKQPLAVLTVGDFIKAVTESSECRQFLRTLVKSVLKDEEIEKIIEEEKSDKPFTVRGIPGIASIFGCSLPTAQKLKKTVIKEAVSQHGKLIITDVNKAKELFRKYTTEHGTFAALPKV